MKSMHAELPQPERPAQSAGLKRTPQMLMYNSPRMLDSFSDRHLKLEFDSSRFEYTKRINSVLLAASEFEAASADFPIVFVGSGQAGYAAVGVLGLNQDSNAMLDEHGGWRAHAYVPAFVRRYPFLLIEQADGGLCVGIDSEYSGFGREHGSPLFDEDGSQSALLEHAVKFLSDFHQHMLATRRFCSLLAQLDLFVERVFEISRGPQLPPRTVRGFFAVDAERLRSLSDQQLLKLAKGPELMWIHAHIQSLARIGKLTQSHSSPTPASVAKL